MQIRLANKHDLPSLIILKGISDEKRYSLRIFETESGKAAYLIAEDKDRLIGQVFLKFYGTLNDPNTPNMEDLLVAEKFRNQGVGTALIIECERLCREKGFKKIGLSVNPELNAKAKSLYDKLGYISLGQKPYLDGVYNGVEDWVIDLVKTL